MASSDAIILEEEVDPDYEPSEEEIREYALFLGFQLPEDDDLLYLAREALKAPLPAGFKPCAQADSPDEIYYFNFTTGESTWSHPCDDHFKREYDKQRKRKQEQARRKKEEAALTAADQERRRVKDAARELVALQQKERTIAPLSASSSSSSAPLTSARFPAPQFLSAPASLSLPVGIGRSLSSRRNSSSGDSGGHSSQEGHLPAVLRPIIGGRPSSSSSSSLAPLSSSSARDAMARPARLSAAAMEGKEEVRPALPPPSLSVPPPPPTEQKQDSEDIEGSEAPASGGSVDLLPPAGGGVMMAMMRMTPHPSSAANAANAANAPPQSQQVQQPPPLQSQFHSLHYTFSGISMASSSASSSDSSVASSSVSEVPTSAMQALLKTEEAGDVAVTADVPLVPAAAAGQSAQQQASAALTASMGEEQQEEVDANEREEERQLKQQKPRTSLVVVEKLPSVSSASSSSLSSVLTSPAIFQPRNSSQPTQLEEEEGHDLGGSEGSEGEDEGDEDDEDEGEEKEEEGDEEEGSPELSEPEAPTRAGLSHSAAATELRPQIQLLPSNNTPRRAVQRQREKKDRRSRRRAGGGRRKVEEAAPATPTTTTTTTASDETTSSFEDRHRLRHHRHRLTDAEQQLASLLFRGLVASPAPPPLLQPQQLQLQVVESELARAVLASSERQCAALASAHAAVLEALKESCAARTTTTATLNMRNEGGRAVNSLQQGQSERNEAAVQTSVTRLSSPSLLQEAEAETTTMAPVTPPPRAAAASTSDTPTTPLFVLAFTRFRELEQSRVEAISRLLRRHRTALASERASLQARREDWRRRAKEAITNDPGGANSDATRALASEDKRLLLRKEKQECDQATAALNERIDGLKAAALWLKEYRLLIESGDELGDDNAGMRMALGKSRELLSRGQDQLRHLLPDLISALSSSSSSSSSVSKLFVWPHRLLEMADAATGAQAREETIMGHGPHGRLLRQYLRYTQNPGCFFRHNRAKLIEAFLSGPPRADAAGNGIPAATTPKQRGFPPDLGYDGLSDVVSLTTLGSVGGNTTTTAAADESRAATPVMATAEEEGEEEWQSRFTPTPSFSSPSSPSLSEQRRPQAPSTPFVAADWTGSHGGIPQLPYYTPFPPWFAAYPHPYPPPHHHPHPHPHPHPLPTSAWPQQNLFPSPPPPPSSFPLDVLSSPFPSTASARNRTADRRSDNSAAHLRTVKMQRLAKEADVAAANAGRERFLQALAKTRTLKKTLLKHVDFLSSLQREMARSTIDIDKPDAALTAGSFASTTNPR